MWWMLLGLQVGFFLVLLFVLQKLFHGNLLSAMARVQNLQQQNLKKEKELKAYEEKIKAECDKKIRDMNEEVSKQREIAEKEIKAYKDSMAAQVENEKQIVLTGVLQKEKMLEHRFEEEVRRHGLAEAVKILENVFSPKMKELLHRELVEELLESLGKMELTKAPSQDAVKIRTAFPFLAAEKARLKKILALAQDAEIKEAQDASLAAGFILIIGKTEMDGSLKNRFEKTLKEGS
jgi:F0F1-type ATP synthase membrane subunit b/b'